MKVYVTQWNEFVVEHTIDQIRVFDSVDSVVVYIQKCCKKYPNFNCDWKEIFPSEYDIRKIVEEGGNDYIYVLETEVEKLEW